MRKSPAAKRETMGMTRPVTLEAAARTEWARLTHEIEALRAELRRLVAKPSDLTRDDVLRVSQQLDVLIYAAQRLLGKQDAGQEPANACCWA